MLRTSHTGRDAGGGTAGVEEPVQEQGSDIACPAKNQPAAAETATTTTENALANDELIEAIREEASSFADVLDADGFF